MGRIRHGVPVAALLFSAFGSAACGGGSSSAAPPPPSPDFSIAFSPNATTLTEGSVTSAVNVSVTPLNGFAGDVQVTLGALPAGVTSNPASPFSVAAGASTAVIFGAAANAATGNFTISAQGTNGTQTHSASLALAIQSGVASTIPRTSFARTDSNATADNSFGEPHRRHIAYDLTNKHIFIANRAMNRIDVFSTTGQGGVAQISVAGASSADLSADGTTVWIGTSLEQIVAIDTVTLRVKSKYPLTGLTPVPGTIFDRPVEVLSLSNGKCLVRLRQPVSPEALLALWDPVADSLTDLTSTAPSLFQQGVGVLARSGDHMKVLAAANDSSGELAVYDAGGNVVAGPLTLGSVAIPAAAANPDASRFAAVLASSTNTQLVLLDGALQKVASYAPAAIHGVTFSRDAKFLYISESSATSSYVTVLDGHTAQLLGRVPNAWIQGVSSEIEDADETQLLFGLSNRGISFVDASTPGTLSPPAPILSAPPSVQPAEGPITGGTAVVLSGQNLVSPTQLKFGTQNASNILLSGPSEIQANSPASVTNGAVNLAAFFQNGWLALAPDAFSYGPQILQILPNAGVSTGGDPMQIYGYGFGSDATKITIKIGGASTIVQKVESAAGIASSLGLGTDYPFSLERVTLQTPPGSAGKADIVISTSSGSTSSSKSFQYLQSVQSHSNPASYKFPLYDQKRQLVYLSATDHVDVFDLQAGTFKPGGLTLVCKSSSGAIVPGPCPSAALRGMALTPDSSQLIVADFGSQNVYLLHPDAPGTVSLVSVGGVAGFTNSGPARVAATSTETVFVGLSGEGGASGACSTCLGQLNLMASPPTFQPAPQPQVTGLTGAPLLQGNAAGDHVFLAFGSAPGGPVAVWNASTPNQFVTSAANASSADLGAAADGSSFVLQANGTTEVRAADLSLTSIPASAEIAQIPGRVSVPGVTAHPSGALIYQPFLTGAPASPGARGGIDIFDAHSGALRLRIFLPQQFMTDVDGLHGSFLATDENGQRLFAMTSSDGTPQNAALTVVQLAVVPLGIGTVSPSTVAAAGGAILTIRGSGFQSGATVAINGKTASVTFKDASTLSAVVPSLTPGAQQITITNPDGETVSLDASFTAN